MKKGIRTCFACKEKFDKYNSNYLKISLENDELFINIPNSKGKSIYVHNNNDCINKFIKTKVLNKKYHKNFSEETYNKLKEYRGNNDK